MFNTIKVRPAQKLVIENYQLKFNSIQNSSYTVGEG